MCVIMMEMRIGMILEMMMVPRRITLYYVSTHHLKLFAIHTSSLLPHPTVIWWTRVIRCTCIGVYQIQWIVMNMMWKEWRKWNLGVSRARNDGGKDVRIM